MGAVAKRRILVIKLGALGDFVLATGAFKAIRNYHPDALITLLTTAPFAEPGRDCGWFDEVWIDSRARAWQFARWFDLIRRLRAGGFHRVYDLQTADRTAMYFRLLKRPRPEWSGIVRGCSHRQTNPGRGQMHTLDRLADQLAVADLSNTAGQLDIHPDLSWATADFGKFGLSKDFVLVCAGGSAHRLAKRWPARAFAEFAEWLSERRIKPVLIGGTAEAATLADIAAHCRNAVNLCGRTTLHEITAMARHAQTAVGNDTGPMHVIAATECPCVVLFSADSDPARTAPRGAHVTVLRRPRLDSLSVAEVASAIRFREPPTSA